MDATATASSSEDIETPLQPGTQTIERNKIKERIQRLAYVFFWSIVFLNLLAAGVALAIFARVEIDLDFEYLDPDQRAHFENRTENLWQILLRILPEVPADSTRGLYGTGGENWWDFFLQYSTRFLEFIMISHGGLDRLKRRLSPEKIADRQTRGLFVEVIEGAAEDENGRRLCYVQSKTTHRMLKTAKILIGISLVAAALCLKPYLISLTSNYTLHGLAQALFSFVFVMGMVLFGGAVRGLLNTVDSRLFQPKKNHYGEIIGWDRPKSRVAFKIGLFAAALATACYLNVIASQIKTFRVVNGIKQFIAGGFISQNVLVALVTLLGIAVLGRIILESIAKNKTIRLFKSHNSLMGLKNQDDAFTNDAINNNFKISYGFIADSNKSIRLAIPSGHKISYDNKGNMVLLAKDYIADLPQVDKDNLAFDEEGNYYETDSDKRRNNKRRQYFKLFLWMTAWYSATFFFYSLNYILDKTVVSSLTPIIGNDWAVTVSTLTDGTSYIFAIIFSIQAINVCFKLLHLFINDKEFLCDLRKKETFTLNDETKLTNIERKSTICKWGSITAATFTTGGLAAFVVLFAEKKLEMNNYKAFAVVFMAFIALRLLIGLAVMYNERIDIIGKFKNTRPTNESVKDLPGNAIDTTTVGGAATALETTVRTTA